MVRSIFAITSIGRACLKGFKCVSRPGKRLVLEYCKREWWQSDLIGKDWDIETDAKRSMFFADLSFCSP